MQQCRSRHFMACFVWPVLEVYFRMRKNALWQCLFLFMNLANSLHGNCAVGIYTWSDESSALLLAPALVYTSWGKYNLLLRLVSKFLFGESAEDCHPICVAKIEKKKTNPKHRLNVFNYFLISKPSSGYYIGAFVLPVALQPYWHHVLSFFEITNFTQGRR